MVDERFSQCLVAPYIGYVMGYLYSPNSTIPLPFFRCRFAVPVSRCRMPWLVGVDWLASYGTEQRKK